MAEIPHQKEQRRHNDKTHSEDDFLFFPHGTFLLWYKTANLFYIHLLSYSKFHYSSAYDQ